MALFTNRTFKNERLAMCGNVYRNCLIEDCILVFDGTGPVEMHETPIKRSHWDIVGPAGLTIVFMHSMYQHPESRPLIEEIIGRITASPVQTAN